MPIATQWSVRSLSSVLALASTLSACGPTASDVEEPAPWTIVVTPIDAELTSVSQTVQLDAIVKDGTGQSVDTATVGWISADPEVATVDAGGLVTAVANGSATIVAKRDLLADSAHVVVAQEAYSLAVSQPTGDVAPGLPVSVEVTILDSLGSLVAGYGAAVTIELDVNDQNATIEGTTTIPASSGVAAFSDLMISRAGQAFTIAASSGTLEGSSGPFDVRLRFASITGGESIICALSHLGDAYCWGKNATGGLGLGFSGANVSRPTLVAGDHEFVQLDAGPASNEGGTFDGFACGVTLDGDAYCWGKNTHGQLGNGTTGVDTDHPVLVSGGMTWSSVTAARDHTCALNAASVAYCWGRKGFGLLGNGSSQPAITDVPLAVSGGRVYTTLEAGVWPTCGVSTDTRTYCWHSLTGLPESTVFEPTLIPGDPSIELQQIDPGTFLHRCGVSTANDGYCWGRGVEGALGVADTLDRAEPTLVAGGHDWRSINAGGFWSCGLRTDGVVMCWGRDNLGVTGQGVANSPTKLLVPTAIVGGLAFTQITEGGGTICGLVANGEAYCWGFGGRGALGNGTFVTSSPAPVKVVLPGGP